MSPRWQNPKSSGGTVTNASLATITGGQAAVAIAGGGAVVNDGAVVSQNGNVVLIGSKTDLPLDWMPRLLAGGPHPSKVLTGRELKEWIAGAPITTDATATQSPPPSKNIFQLRQGANLD